MTALSENIRSKGKRIAFVPTMGALHKGHLSLISIAKEKADIVVVSIYVNPLQFAPNEDFATYPRDIEGDTVKCENAGCDILFVPGNTDLYPEKESFRIDVGEMGKVLDGITRPHFFGGVATVVAKLFHLVRPHIAIFGQKDLQQGIVIKKLVRDFKFNINIILGPIIREGNGLAMSSRNEYLSQHDRDRAGVIFTTLQHGVKTIMAGERDRKIINAEMIKHFRSYGDLNLDYIQAVAALDLETPDAFLPGEEIALLIAAYSGKTRLIDNTIVKVPEHKLDDKTDDRFIELGE